MGAILTFRNGGNRRGNSGFQHGFRGGNTKKACVAKHRLEESGGKDRDRTDDTGIFSPLLYQLSYLATLKTDIGVPGGIRTPDLLVRSQSLYPAELQVHAQVIFENYAA